MEAHHAPAKPFPDVTTVAQIGSHWIVLTQVDYHKREGRFAFFDTEKEARKAIHDWSLAQLPGWHREHCPVCLEGEDP